MVMSEGLLRSGIYIHVPKTEAMNQEKKNTENNDIQMRFHEYPVWKKGQHFIAILVKTPGKHFAVGGRIYKEYDPHMEVSSYRATDVTGNTFLAPTAKLHELKRNIYQEREKLAAILLHHNQEVEKEQLTPQEAERKQSLKSLRVSRSKEPTRTR
ncbi:MAG: hypothetical protein FD123_425 [Bacteroidetes bacterium]|nr:MAG: hypothetical protein FD123_425 [Bacteroidota bacterium]